MLLKAALVALSVCLSIAGGVGGLVMHTQKNSRPGPRPQMISQAVEFTGPAVAVVKLPADVPVRSLRVGVTAGLQISFSLRGTPPSTTRIGKIYIVRRGGQTLCWASYLSSLPRLRSSDGRYVVYASFTFKEPGAYRFIGRLSVDGVMRQAATQIQVTR